MVINFIKKLFTPKDPVEHYLANSHDVYDLENRLKELRRKGIWV
jgi:hypothetical protein